MAWSDPEISELLGEFIPCADEVWQLHRRNTPEAKLFRSFCEDDHYAPRKGKGSTRQGMYVVTASGKLLCSWNARRKDVVDKKLREGLTKWKAMAKAERTPMAPLLADAPTRRAELAYPEDGLALRVFSRDLPREDLPDDWRASAWNIDHLWLTKAEARALAAGELPAEAASRLVRLHGRDNVRGQSAPFKRQHVEHAQVTSKPSRNAVDAKAGIIEITGSVKVSETGSWQINDRFDPATKLTRSFEGTLYGKAKWDGARFTEFRLVMAGTRAGATQFNERADDLGPAPMAVVFELADPTDRVAPSVFWAYGWPIPSGPSEAGGSK